MKRFAIAALTSSAFFQVAYTTARADSLKFAYFALQDEAAYRLVFQPWIDKINSEARGATEIVGYPNGALGRAVPQQAQMVLDGVADIAFIVTSSTPGRFPDTAPLELPGLYENVSQATLVNNKVVTSFGLKGLDAYKVIAGFGSAPLSAYTTSENCSLSALRGKKLRVTTPTDGQALAAFGAVPLQISITEVTEAMGRRTIDGAITNPQTLFDYGINRVTKCANRLKMSSALLVVVMNKAKYETLQPEAKAVLDQYSGIWLANLYAKEMGKLVDGLNTDLGQTLGKEMRTPDSDETAKLNGIYAGIRQSVAPAGSPGARILDLVAEFKADLANKP